MEHAKWHKTEWVQEGFGDGTLLGLDGVMEDDGSVGGRGKGGQLVLGVRSLSRDLLKPQSPPLLWHKCCTISQNRAAIHGERVEMRSLNVILPASCTDQSRLNNLLSRPRDRGAVQWCRPVLQARYSHPITRHLLTIPFSFHVCGDKHWKQNGVWNKWNQSGGHRGEWGSTLTDCLVLLIRQRAIM